MRIFSSECPNKAGEEDWNWLKSKRSFLYRQDMLNLRVENESCLERGNIQDFDF